MQHRQRAVFGAEVVAPLAHTVRLVNGKQAEFAPAVQAVEQVEKTRRRQALRRGIQQRDLAALHAPLHVQRLLPVECGVEESRLHPRLVQRTHLVVHQRNQRRHHDRNPMPRLPPHDRRNLVTQRLAAARWHQHQGVTAANHLFNDGLLGATKLLVAKNVVQDGMRCGQTEYS